MCPADIESATLIQWFLRAAPNVAAAYNHAGNDYIAYAGGDPTHLFAFNASHAYADQRISTLLDTKLTDLRVPARFVFSTRVAVREAGYGVSWVEPCERWTSSFPMNSSGSRRPTLQVADSWNAPPPPARGAPPTNCASIIVAAGNRPCARSRRRHGDNSGVDKVGAV